MNANYATVPAGNKTGGNTSHGDRASTGSEARTFDTSTLTCFHGREGVMSTIRTVFLIAVAALSIVWSGTSHAQTVANTPVNNTATLNYQVNGTAMPQKTANAQFVVDRKIDFTVVTTNAAAIDVYPGESTKYLTFTVTNTGNAAFDYSLLADDADANPFGAPADSFDATVSAVVESGATPLYQPGEDTAVYINDLAAGATATVYVVGTILSTQVNDDVSAIDLVVQVAEASGTPGADITTDDSGTADVAGTMQDVFADAAGTATGDDDNDGIHSDDSAFRVRSANLTITKTSAVVSDPVSGTTNPKAIPGAVIRYTVTVQNTAGSGASATNIIVSDNLTTEIGNSTISYEAGTITVTAPNINGGVLKTLTDGSDADEGNFGITTGNTVTVSGIALAAGATATVTFDVAIQ